MSAVLPSITITHLATGPTPPLAASTDGPNTLHTRVAEVVARMGPPPWSRRIIRDERNLVTLIANAPGGGNRPHWHAEFDEWCEHEVEAEERHQRVPRGAVHHIRTVGTENSLRLAVAMPPAMHYFSPCEQCGYTDDGPREWCA